MNQDKNREISNRDREIECLRNSRDDFIARIKQENVDARHGLTEAQKQLAATITAASFTWPVTIACTFCTSLSKRFQQKSQLSPSSSFHSWCSTSCHNISSTSAVTTHTKACSCRNAEHPATQGSTSAAITITTTIAAVLPTNV